MLGVQADTTGILRGTAFTLRRLGALTGFDQRTVLRGFAGVVLKAWAARTKVSTQEHAERSERLRAIRDLGYTGKSRVKERGEVTVNAGFRPAPFGRVWIKVRSRNGRKNWLLARGSDFSAPTGSGIFDPRKRALRGAAQLWAANVNDAEQDVRVALRRRLPLARRSVGLSRQAVLQIADSLGIDLLRVQGGGILSGAAIAKARAALASSGKFYRNGTGYQSGGVVSAYIDLINRLPYGRAIGADRTLLGVLAGQNKYFELSYAKGAFDTQRSAVRAYPNLFSFRSSLN